MNQLPDPDRLDVPALQAAGSLKWTTFPGSIGAFVAEMDFGPAPVVTEALHRAVDRGLFGYMPTALMDELASACAQWQRDRYGWEVPAARIRPLPDVLTGLRLMIEHFTEPGSPVIVPTPAYMPFLTIPPAMGREVIQVPLVVDAQGRQALDLDGIDRAFAAGAGLVVLCNPFNPVGRVFDREELLALSEVVERRGGRVFSDEIHAPLVYPGRAHVPYASVSETAAGHALTAASASKAWNLPGLKCAQVILSNDADAERWERVGASAAQSASNLGVAASVAAYREGGPWLDEVLAYLDGNRRELGALLAERIPEIGYTVPEGTYIGWLDCRALGLEDAAGFFREHAGVALTDGAACGEAGRGFVRFIFATPRPVLRQAVEQMAAALAAR